MKLILANVFLHCQVSYLDFQDCRQIDHTSTNKSLYLTNNLKMSGFCCIFKIRMRWVPTSPWATRRLQYEVQEG